MSKDRGLKVLVHSEAGRGELSEALMREVSKADMFITMPTMPDALCEAAREVFS